MKSTATVKPMRSRAHRVTAEAVEQEVHGMRHPIEQMAHDVTAVIVLLPSPSDGPLARLKDTLTSN